MMGGAMIIGNLSGGYLAKNNPKVPFILAVACNLIFGGLVSMFLRETHVPDPAGARAPAAAPRQAKAKAAPGGAVLRLLRSGRTLRLLTISNVLTSVVDLTWTIRSVMALQRLGMGPAEYGVWESVNGVVLGLGLTGLPFSFTALLGLLSLSGMLIKNGIVLVEEIDLTRAADPTLDLKEAIVTADVALHMRQPSGVIYEAFKGFAHFKKVV